MFWVFLIHHHRCRLSDALNIKNKANLDSLPHRDDHFGSKHSIKVEEKYRKRFQRQLPPPSTLKANTRCGFKSSLGEDGLEVAWKSDFCTSFTSLEKKVWLFAEETVQFIQAAGKKHHQCCGSSLNSPPPPSDSYQNNKATAGSNSYASLIPIRL